VCVGRVSILLNFLSHAHPLLRHQADPRYRDTFVRGGRSAGTLGQPAPVAPLMIAAGVNANALSTYMGHASVMITVGRYGHLFPGNEEEASALLDALIGRHVG